LNNFAKYGFVTAAMAILLFAGGCSTKKNTWVRRTFHDITAHYNAYYNGQLALDEARETIAKDHKDNYSEILDVFPLGTDASVKSVSLKLERAHEKASIVIHKHSMVFNDDEKIKWVYYSYMMIGKSRFYGHEYGLAKQTFKYVAGKYSTKDVKYDALLWIARVQVIQGDYDEARGNLGGIQNKLRKGEVSNEVKRLFPMVYADLYLKQQNYDAAIPYLRQAIKVNKKKETKARLFFILAQVEQKQGQLHKAVKDYEQVLKNNPVYEMDFNARINMAKCYDAGSGDSRTITNKLLKMLKDEKNKDYLDQIYFALAEVELKNENIPKAIEYLKLSVEKSTTNNLQKAFSALKLADIYFEKPDYPNAQAYYDSTILFLPRTYPDYELLKERKDVLTELVTNLITVQREDSLQELAAMSESKRNRIIDKLIKDEIAREEAERKAEQERLESLQFMEENRRTTQSVTQGRTNKFYFYNPQTLSYGFTEFRRKWGQRKLTDYWRISNKQVLSFGEEEDFTEEQKAKADSIQKLKNNKKSRQYYLKDIPLTQELIDSSNKRIYTALYNMGFIYKEKLNNYPKAIESFEKLLKRYPKTKYTPAAYYFLYQLYESKGEMSDARFYKKALLKEYPETDYAKILRDPVYYKKLMAKADKLKKVYKKAYRMYHLGNYTKAIAYADEAIRDYPEATLTLSKCEMIKALSVGKTSDTAAFISALNKVVNDYPQTDAANLAADIIKRLNEGKKMDKSKPPPTLEEKKKQISIYSYDPEATHMFIIVVNRKNMRASEFQQRIANHNDKYFATDKLTVSAIPINKELVVVGVSNFKNKKEAVTYFKTLKRNTVLYGMMRRTNHNYFLISQDNYTKLYKTRNLDAYKEFYAKYYPEGK